MRQFLLFLLTGVICALVATNGLGRGSYMVWYAATWSMAFGVFILGASSGRNLRLLLTWAMVLLVFGLCAATLAVGVASLNPLQLNYRPSLWMGNSNLLAAAIVVSATASISVIRSRWVPSVLIVVAFCALLLTGSRTAIFAFVLAIVSVMLLRQSRPWWQRITTVMGFAALILIMPLLSSTARIALQDSDSQNLIYPTDDFRHNNWHKLGLNVRVNQVDEPGPQPGGSVVRLRGEADPAVTHNILIYQSRGVAPEGFQFVSSVYARAATPQWIEISANYTRTDCLVTTSWTRCIAPAATGNGDGAIQLQVNAVAKGESVDVYLWGPQIEEGVTAGDVSFRPTNVLSTLDDAGVLARMNLSQLFQIGDAGRSDLGQRAWSAFAANPWTGVGFGNVAAWEKETQQIVGEESSVRIYSHAHNILLQHLAEGGIFGALSFLIPFLGVAYFAMIRSRLAALPIVAAILALNFSDYTFYYVWVFVPYWLSLGLCLSSERENAANVADYSS